MKIRHKDGREVNAVKQVYKDWPEWIKDEVRYHGRDGWSEVPEPEWENVTGEVGIDSLGRLRVPDNQGGHRVFDLPMCLSWHKTTMHAIDENFFKIELRNRGLSHSSIGEVWHAIVGHQQHALIIQKKKS